MLASCAILVASLGNPGPLQITRHSAGHILLRSLAQYLKAPPFSRSKPYAAGQLSTTTISPPAHKPTSSRHLVRQPMTISLWQSPTLMNVSGPAVLTAWRAFCKDHQHQGPTTTTSSSSSSSTSSFTGPEQPALGLLILHDDLDSQRASLKIRHGLAGSARGHNGLKSVLASFSGAGGREGMDRRLVRIGIGVGRPPGAGKGRAEVSDYVLTECTPPEREGIESLAGRVEQTILEEGERIAGLVR